MKKLLWALAMCLGLSIQPAAALPSKTVRIVTAMPVGSAPDVVVRKVAEQLTKTWNVPVIVENKPGGSGAVAIQYFLNQPKDSHTVLYGDITIFTAYPVLYKKEEILNDIKMLTPVLSTQWLLAVSTNVGSYQDLEKLVQSRDAIFGSWAMGSAGHTAGNELALHLKSPATHVVYRDYSQWLGDLASQRLPYSFVTYGSTRQFVEAGKLKYLAVTGPERNSVLPNVPTVKELLGKDFATPNGIVAFAVDRDIDTALEKELLSGIQTALSHPSVVAAITSNGYSPIKMSQAAFIKEHQRQFVTIKKLINDFKITVD